MTDPTLKTPDTESVDCVIARVASSGFRIFHRMPVVDTTDRRTPRMFAADEYMAIEPRALERAFFPFFFDDADAKPYDMHGGVAIVTIDGPLSQRGGWWWDGYEQIRDRFEKALEDKAVGAVLLKISSPGGVVSGCFGQGRAMRDAKVESGKPVFAYADESAYSAAYAMACVADKIFLPREGGVGSVGVIGVLEDYTAFNEKMGIKVAVITSGKHKADGHPDVALTKDVITRYQKRIDMLAQSFGEFVGEARGMSTSKVLDLEADCFYGTEAVSTGLADAVKTYDEVLDIAQVEASKRLTANASRGRQTAAAATRTIQIRRHV